MVSNSGMIQGISVVTTTWNEAENIEELIRRVRSTLQDVPHEIIVIDDASSDGTLTIAERFADVLVVASRSVVPRFSERCAAKTLGKICGVSDFYSNFRSYKKQGLPKDLMGGETFGGELLGCN